MGVLATESKMGTGQCISRGKEDFFNKGYYGCLTSAQSLGACRQGVGSQKKQWVKIVKADV